MRAVLGVPLIRAEQTHDDAVAVAAASVERAAVPADRVVVIPGGAVFTTVSAALDSIADASATKPYDVLVGSGTFEERVTLKDYVHLEGAGSSETTIQSPPTSIQDSGILVAASNASVTGATIACLGGTWGDWGTAVLCSGAKLFTLSECILIADDQNNAGINIVTLQIDVASDAGSDIEIIDTEIKAIAQNQQSVATAVSTWNQAAVRVQPGCKIIATGDTQSYAVIASSASTELYYSYVQGKSYSVYKWVPSASVVANHCQLDGPVSPGVVVIDGTPQP